MSSSSSFSSAAGVQVVVRLRPLNEKEKKHGTLPVVSGSTNEKTVTVVKGLGTKRQRCCYKFDNVFTAFSTQQEVFHATLHPIIKDVMNGYESTVFAYGQTGTGKTHTMEGNLKSSEEYGIIPRSAEAIFQELDKPEYQSWNVKCSYLEIYNEELCDLLLGGGADNNHEQKQRKQLHNNTIKPSTSTTKLQIVEGKNGPYCKGLSCQSVANASQVLNLIRRADQQRKVGETKMNKQSSRSHCIFTISVNATKQCSAHDGSSSLLEIQGKLHLVDLAGSECAKNANMDGTPSKHQAARERERMNINRSLLTLGRVVSMLKEQSSTNTAGGGGKKSSSSSNNAMRIPYRDSKLTRILQESLGGRCKTCIIATLSPSVMAVEESISTLNYAQAANGIINKPISTSYMSQSSSTQTALIPNKNSGGNSNSGEGGIGSVEHWQEMELRLEYMQVQVDEAKGALARKHLEHQELVEQAETAEIARQQMEDQYNAALAETAAMKQQHANEVAAHKATQLQLRQTIAILNATQNTEVCLTKEANCLIDALKKSIDDGNNLQQMIVENKQDDMNRKLATKQFNTSAQTILENVVVSLNELSESETRYRNQLNQMAVDGENHHLEFTAKVFETIRSTSDKVKTTAKALQSHVHGTNGDKENDDRKLTAGTGLLASSKAVVSGVTEGVTNVKHSIAEGEDKLQQGFDACKEQLSDYGIKLNKLESIHSESCQKTLQELDQNVSTSKGKLLNLVSSATKALEEAKMERMKVQDAVTHILQQWKTSTTDSSRQIGDQSSTQQTAVTEMLDTMNTEMKRYDDMELYLSNQKSMLQNAGADHSLDLKTQGELLMSHKDALVTSQQQQKEVCEQVVQNVMTGIQDLVQKQMATILKTQNDNFTTLIDTNRGLIERNSGSYNRFNNDIVRDVDSTNANLRNEVQAIRRTDRSVAGVLENTDSVLSTIKQASVNQIASVDKYAAEAIKGIQDINQLEASSSTKIKDKMSSDSEQCVEHLQQVLHQSTKKGITKVADTGNDVISFTRDGVLAPMSSTINAMEEPRPAMMTTFNRKCDTILTTVQQGCSEIEQTAQNVSKATEEMENGVISTENGFINNTAEAHKITIGKYREDLTECATKHCDATTTALSDTMTKSTNAKDAVRDYATNVIRINEEVESAPDRNVIEYNATLTATPLDHIILKNLEEDDDNNIDKPSSEEEDTEVAIATTSRNDENTEVNMSTESMLSLGSSINHKATRTMSPRHQQGGKHMEPSSVSSPSNKKFAAAESKIPTHHKRTVQRGGTPVVKKRTKR